MKKNDSLRMWQERLAAAKAKYNSELEKMDKREMLYRGEASLEPVYEGQNLPDNKKPLHRHNIIAENIESMIDNNVPMPKVTARNPEDSNLAKIIEDMLRNELDRLPMEVYNDLCERTVPIQGGTIHLVEWDNAKRTHTTVGETELTMVHPKQAIPQDGVYSGIEDMDYIFVQLPQTKEYIRQRFGIDVSLESESAPEIKNAGDSATAEDMITLNIAYFRNEEGGIGKYSWVNDTEIENLQDYQARRLKRCVVCGAVKPLTEDLTALDAPTLDGTPPEVVMAQQLAKNYTGNGSAYPTALPLAKKAKPHERNGDMCPYCGSSKWEDSEYEYEEIYNRKVTKSGKEIPGGHMVIDENGEAVMEPTLIPFYKPNVYPVVLQKNVSVFGRFLGESDVDKIETQQNTINHIDMQINERLMKAGTRVTLPKRPDLKLDGKNHDTWYLNGPEEKHLIDVYTFSGDLQYEMLRRRDVYEQARQELGVTNSYQGREEGSTSGKAREIMAEQSAGRLESRRIMKYAAYARIFELMFKFRLAYADETRPVSGTDSNGEPVYDSFDRYEFLKQDDAGEWYWEDNFIFSCDNASNLASNREKMWQECTAHLQAGAFGNPTELQTLILYWSKMEALFYPGAGETKRALEERLQEQKAQQQQMLELQRLQMLQNSAPPMP